MILEGIRGIAEIFKTVDSTYNGASGFGKGVLVIILMGITICIFSKMRK